MRPTRSLQNDLEHLHFAQPSKTSSFYYAEKIFTELLCCRDAYKEYPINEISTKGLYNSVGYSTRKYGKERKQKFYISFSSAPTLCLDYRRILPFPRKIIQSELHHRIRDVELWSSLESVTNIVKSRLTLYTLVLKRKVSGTPL